jgi:predicted ATPase/DNA-binding winged helix-turn-helix (wHTH) protein
VSLASKPATRGTEAFGSKDREVRPFVGTPLAEADARDGFNRSTQPSGRLLVVPVRSVERYCFGRFQLQPDKRRLLKEGATVSLRPRAFDLLAVLVERAGHLVTKDELLDQVWPKMVVEEAALHVQVSALRKILGADAITTVSGRGYQFTLSVTKGDGEANRASRSKHNLPYQLTSFIGREQEIAQLEELVTANRLVTLTGAGGAGKTRLAIQVARRLTDAFPDGVWLVELAALSDPGLVPQAVAQALALADQPARPVIETLSEYLASKKLLLVLDNAEHLLEGCVQLVYLILRRSPHVTLLVTSRERLGMAGELTYRVPSLTVPGPGDNFGPEALLAYEGMRLFVDRARLLRPDFSVTSENAASLASICFRLDGIPLAIELAAPRLRSMSVEELSQRLDHRFALLTDGSRTALPRHRTLRSMIDWSYDLLTDVEQAMLRRAAVFADGWTLAAAEHVCTGDGIESANTIDLLESLADKNLVSVEEHDGTTRYRMLETIRQYALDRLREAGEEAQGRNRHFVCYLALAEESFEPLGCREQRECLDRIAREIDNFRAALTWTIEQKLPDAFRMVPENYRSWVRRVHVAEAREWFSRLLDAIPSDQAKRDRARVLRALGQLAVRQGDLDGAERLYRESLALFRELDDARGSAYLQTNLALLEMARGQYADAEPLLENCADLARALGETFLVAVNLGNLAIVAHARGDGEAAATLFEESLTLARRVGDPFLESHFLSYKGRAALSDGDLVSAEATFVESLAMAHELADPFATMWALERFAELAAARHAHTRAATILGAAAHVREEIGLSLPLHDEREHTRVAAATRVALGDDAFDQTWREGSAMELEEAVRYTLGVQTGRDA